MKHIDYCMDLELMLTANEKGTMTNKEFSRALDSLCTTIGTGFLATEILKRMPAGTVERMDKALEGVE